MFLFLEKKLYEIDQRQDSRSLDETMGPQPEYKVHTHDKNCKACAKEIRQVMNQARVNEPNQTVAQTCKHYGYVNEPSIFLRNHMFKLKQSACVA